MWRSGMWRKRDVEERNWGSEEGSESERSRWECRAEVEHVGWPERLE